MTPEEGQAALDAAPYGAVVAVVAGLPPEACPYCTVAPEAGPCALHRDHRPGLASLARATR